MPSRPAPTPGRSVAIALCIAAMTGYGGDAADSASTPFHGVPHAVPGRIEAEEFDLGADGVAFHGAGPVFVNHHGWPIPRERPDAAIAVGRSNHGFGPNQVWMRGGEWMVYTVEVAESGSYTVLLQTGGAPTYAQETGDCLNRFQGGQGAVTYHLEVDGFRATPDLAAAPQVVSSRVWLDAGRHQLRLVLDFVSDVSGLHYAFGSEPDGMRFFTFPVDWLDVVKSPLLLAPTPVAGGIPGFQDGTGADACFGYRTRLVGQTPGGDLVLFDEINAAYRIAGTNGEVRSLAGFPGNPPRDGTGSQAGFGRVVHSLISPSGDLLSLESQPDGGYRIARIDPSGVVVTIYSGTPLARMSDTVPGWQSGVTNVPVPLLRLELNDQGYVEAIGGFTEFRLYSCGPWGQIYHDPIPWLARYRFISQEAREVAILGYFPLPTMDPRDLGEGYRIERFRLLREEPAGFVHEVLPGTDVFSVVRTADRTLWAMIEGVLCRLAPDPFTGILNVYTEGIGGVAGVPGRWIPAGDQILLSAAPGSRFSQFAGWSDGNTDNPRTVTSGRDTTLTARFEIRFPELHGIDPRSPIIGPDGYFQFKVFGHSEPYQYQFQQSDNLRDWIPVARRGIQLRGAGDLQDGSISAAESEVWVRMIPGGAARYFRAVMQDR